MALASNGAVYRALNDSINAACATGKLDRGRHGATIAAARKVARLMDDPEWPIVAGGKFDNVSPALFLKYCQALGLTPELDGKEQTRAAPSKLTMLRNNAAGMRFAANG